MRRASRTDQNQPKLVRQLRAIPGVTVETNHNDLLIGYRNRTFWVEIKNPDRAIKKSGGLKSGALRDSQKRIKAEWTGQYLVAWELDQILKEIGVIKSTTE